MAMSFSVVCMTMWSTRVGARASLGPVRVDLSASCEAVSFRPCYDPAALSGRYLVHTFGCQMNAHDSDRMEEVLRASGWARAENVEEADLVVLNTCSVREKAEQKLRSEVGKLAPLKAKNPGLVLAVAGCVAQQEGDKLLTRVPHLDLIIGPDNIGELPGLVRDQMDGA